MKRKKKIEGQTQEDLDGKNRKSGHKQRKNSRYEEEWKEWINETGKSDSLKGKRIAKKKNTPFSNMTLISKVYNPAFKANFFGLPIKKYFFKQNILGKFL